MLTIPTPVKIFVCVQPIDFRRSFDGLAEMVREGLREDPLSGHWFVFRNRRGDRFKLLLWDEDGLMLVYKRLEVGKYQFPQGDGRSPRSASHGAGTLAHAVGHRSTFRSATNALRVASREVVAAEFRSGKNPREKNEKDPRGARPFS